MCTLLPDAQCTEQSTTIESKWGNVAAAHILKAIKTIPFCRRVYNLTVCYLQLGLRHDAARHSERLADVIPCVGALHGRNGQLPVHRHRDSAVVVRRLVGKQKLLQGEMEGIICYIVSIKSIGMGELSAASGKVRTRSRWGAFILDFNT